MMTILTLVSFLYPIDNPPGTIKINEYYVDKTEVQNIHWQEYVYFKSRDLDSSKLNEILPDTSNFWYQSVDNRFKPIVLISFEQALEYCSWRSQVVSKRLKKKVIYRLPTKKEWREIAKHILDNELKRTEKELKKIGNRIDKKPGEYIMMDRENPANRIYDMFTNVTEMALKKGVAVGASNYDLTDLESNLTNVFEYNSPNAYLGFRCVAEWVD